MALDKNCLQEYWSMKDALIRCEHQVIILFNHLDSCCAYWAFKWIINIRIIICCTLYATSKVVLRTSESSCEVCLGTEELASVAYYILNDRSLEMYWLPICVCTACAPLCA